MSSTPTRYLRHSDSLILNLLRLQFQYASRNLFFIYQKTTLLFTKQILQQQYILPPSPLSDFQYVEKEVDYIVFYCEWRLLILIQRIRKITRRMSDSSIKMKSHSSLLAFKIKKKLSEVPYNDFLTTTVRPEYTDNIQNGLLASRSHDRIRQLTNTFNILQALDIFMLFYYYQLDFQGNLYSPFWLILTYIVHLVAAVLLGVVIYVEYDSLDWKIKCSFNTGQKIAELIAFVVVHPVPWISGITFDLPYDSPTFGNLTVPIEVNYIILLITIMKGIGIFLAKFLINSQYMQPRASRIKKIYSVTAKKIIYAIRCIFRDKPIRMFFSYFIIGTTFFSFSLKVIESNVPEPKNPFLYYQNCVWYMLITTTTTGYGQIRPYTHVGYCCIVVATLFGSFCISGTVFILLNALTLSAKEQAGLTAFRKVTSHLRYKENCRLYIRMTIWRLWTNHKNKRHVKESFQERKLRAKLRQIRLQGKSLNSTGNIIELCQRQFDSAFINTNFLCENNVNLVNFINSHIFSEDLFRERGMYTRSYITESREVTSEDDQSEDEYTKLRRKKLYKRSHFAESRKNIQSRKHIKIRVLKEPSFGGDEEIGEIKIH